ncbi:excinuclease ABC subunit UvrC [Marinilabiliaceae bacterium JC017]|nr:excinuclease ABC subunit UvrC [Marinilabiliaceae bacterium JC017]
MNANFNKNIEFLKEKISVLPDTPGVYQYFNEEGKIIYIGKAKNLKKRVYSYFSKVPEDGKTRVLVRKIADIKHIVVETEEDALLLENNLIKKYQPRYNVLLKDDKSFPWIVIKNEPFPRVFQTRNLIKDGSQYFGPYTSTGVVRTLLDLFRQLYPLRTCNYNLSKENINKGSYKVCLEYHIGNCKGPCVNEFDEEKYLENISHIKDILKGNISSVIKYLKDLMYKYATDLKFEKAEELKKRINMLDGYQSKSTIVSPKINNIDVFSIIEDETNAYVNFMKVVNGGIIQSHTMEYKKKLTETKEEILSLAISEIKDRLKILAREIIVPIMPDVSFSESKYLIPMIGDKKKLLDLSERNVKYYRLEKLKQHANRKKISREDRILNTLREDLRLSSLPAHIECFDNSNIQGTNPVAACVVFKNAKPSKKDYRHFNIKTVVGPDDFASMEEVVFRRYKRLIEENEPLPQLIIIDGGKGQLGASLKALEKLGLRGNIAIIGVAKKLEEIFFPGDPYPLYLDKNSESLKLIQHLRNEAHRFGITFHRNKRSGSFIKSELDQIKGIGGKTKEILFTHFKTISKIKSASKEDLEAVIGKAKAQLIIFHFGNRI